MSNTTSHSTSTVRRLRRSALSLAAVLTTLFVGAPFAGARVPPFDPPLVERSVAPHSTPAPGTSPWTYVLLAAAASAVVLAAWLIAARIRQSRQVVAATA